MTMDKNRIKEICAGIKQLPTPITWSLMTRIDAVDEGLLGMLADAGCKSIDYGVESGSPETLRKIHKPHTVNMSREIVRLTAEAGIKPNVFFILGFPWEGSEELNMTKKLMDELSPYVDTFHPAIASILIPFPGTELYEKYKDAYKYENWWLSNKRNYGAAKLCTHSFYETRLFAFGAVLDADFYHYSQEVRSGIIEIFTFMFMHNLKNEGRLSRMINAFMFNSSVILNNISPGLERTVFGAIMKLKRIVR
jgi:radical SAM superfamily enzyme YgiQ (UPF0313 family)